MLDFRSQRQSKKLPYGPEVSRWLWMLFFLGLVLIVGSQLMQPATWQFIVRGFRLGSGSQQRAIDTRLTSKSKEDSSGAVVFVPSDPSEPAVPILPVDFHQESVLTPQELQQIQDDALFRRAEREVWRRLLELLHQTEASELQKRSEGTVSYGQLFRQSPAYRGRLVTVRGQLRRVERVPMPSNSWGQPYYYQTWLQPVDQPSNPMQIYCLELPEGFPLGLHIQEEVEVTGFYFKRVAYMAQDGLRTAPTLVAKTLRWFPRPTLTPEPQPLTGTPLVAVLVTAAGLGIATAVVLYYRVRPKERFEVPKVVDLSEVAAWEEPTPAPRKEQESSPPGAEAPSGATGPDIHQAETQPSST